MHQDRSAEEERGEHEVEALVGACGQGRFHGSGPTVLDAMGKDLSPYRGAFAQILCVADTDEQAEELYAEHILYFYNRCLHVFPGFSDPPGYRTIKTIKAGKLNQLRAENLKKFDFLTVTVEGHCDERGTVEYNLALGERRAQSTYDYLVSLGVAASRFKTISYGEERPFCTESNEACWQKNRRARFVISGS